MSNDQHQDKRVSEAYRSLASEKTPQHLDSQILQMAAAQAKRPTYSRWMAWSRPLAWAATITLCLAITLELARDPSLEPTLEMPDDSAAIEGNLRKDESAQPEKEQPIDISTTLADSIASEKVALGRSASAQPASTPAPAARARMSTDEDASAPAESYEFEEQRSKSTDAALRNEAAPTALTNSAYAEADMAIEEVVVVGDCPKIVQEDPEVWLECILDLQDAGNEEGAEREREALIDTFPDFKIP